MKTLANHANYDCENSSDPQVAFELMSWIWTKE